MSHTFDLAKIEGGLIGDCHFIDKRATSKRYGNLFVGALKICEVVNAYLQTWLFTLNIQESNSYLDFVYTSHMHNKTSLKDVSSILTTLL